MRTAGCAALMEAVVRNNGALNGRHDRDNRQGGEEGRGKCKDKKQKKKKQTDKETKEAVHQGNKSIRNVQLKSLAGVRDC